LNKAENAARELHAMDDLAAQESPLHALHPLSKLIMTVAYIFITVSFDKYALSALFPMLLFVLFGYRVSGVPIRQCFHKLRIVMPLVCAVGVLNPFFDRAAVTRIGALTVTGGVLSMLTLMMKGIYCLMASFLLAATTTIEDVCRALRLLHVPKIITSLVLLTYHYVTVLLNEVAIMTDAYHLRAPGQKGVHFTAWGSVSGATAAAEHGSRAGAVREHAAARLSRRVHDPLCGRQKGARCARVHREHPADDRGAQAEPDRPPRWRVPPLTACPRKTAPIFRYKKKKTRREHFR
jgi:ABC-type cobalt transport system, permease component CbiQ and related transporters